LPITFSQIADGGDLEPQKVGLTKNFNKMLKNSINNEPPAIGNLLLAAVPAKDGVGVYCKCGKIIYAATNDCLKRDKEAQKDIDAYFDKGYQIGRVSKEDVRELFGCDCRKA
jgi:hypothetical protein